MPYSPETRSKRRVKRPPSCPEIGWFKDQVPLSHVLFKMQLESLSPRKGDVPCESLTITPDPFSLLSDRLLLHILAKLPISYHTTTSLVCKRWMHLHGRLVESLKLVHWDFLHSGRLLRRFPNLTDIDLVRASVRLHKNSGILLSHKFLSIELDPRCLSDGFVSGDDLLPPDVIDEGLRMVAQGCPNLRKLVLIGASEGGLSSVAAECLTLQELELHYCSDLSLKGISGCRNLQILKLIGSVLELYNSVISDIGLTILAQGCRRLVKLELCGCEGSYDGIKAIGQCCQMLEELTLCDHRMDGGWLSALSFCANLKTLKLQSCRTIDVSPGSDEHLGSCPTLETLHVLGCQMRDKQSTRALLLVCQAVREIVLQDCWGLEDETFGIASICRYEPFFVVLFYLI